MNIREAMKNVPWEVVFFAAVAACITSVVSSSGLGSWIANIFLNWTVGLPLFLILLSSASSGVLNGLTMTSPASAWLGFFPPTVTLPPCWPCRSATW